MGILFFQASFGLSCGGNSKSEQIESDERLFEKYKDEKLISGNLISFETIILRQGVKQMMLGTSIDVLKISENENDNPKTLFWKYGTGGCSNGKKINLHQEKFYAISSESYDEFYAKTRNNNFYGSSEKLIRTLDDLYKQNPKAIPVELFTKKEFERIFVSRGFEKPAGIQNKENQKRRIAFFSAGFLLISLALFWAWRRRKIKPTA